MIHDLQKYPRTRLRRLRSHHFLRALTAEHRLCVQDLILPLFVCANHEKELEIPSMPGIKRTRIRDLAAFGEATEKLGIGMVALFPVVPAAQKSPYGQEALNAKGLMPQAIATLKAACPRLGVMVDVALDPYTTSGHDGISDADGRIANDATVEILCQQALCLAAAGADVLAPSDMMDGRVGAIRTALDNKHYEDRVILSYAVKYASSLYSPFRQAIGSDQNLDKQNKLTYQMNPTNAAEALREVDMDLQEGADIVIVKPAGLYLDVVHRIHQEFAAPVFVYQVSGEYTMLKLLAGDSNYHPLMMESLVACKRAGASAIISYFAAAAAAVLRSKEASN